MCSNFSAFLPAVRYFTDSLFQKSYLLEIAIGRICQGQPNPIGIYEYRRMHYSREYSSSILVVFNLAEGHMATSGSSNTAWTTCRDDVVSGASANPLVAVQMKYTVVKLDAIMITSQKNLHAQWLDW